MFHMVHQLAFYAHVTVGSAALLIFWLPFFTRKGHKRHRLIGKLFTNSMYIISVSGVIMSSLVLLDPVAVRYPDGGLDADVAERFVYQSRIFAGFLFMLSILVINNVRQAVLVLAAKAQRDQLKTPTNLASIAFLGVLGAIVGLIGLREQVLLFDVFAVICIGNSIGMFRYIYKPAIKEREWIIEHLGNICGAGIAAYTAFLSFGGRRLLGDLFAGNLQIVPWVLPAIVGVFAISILTRKYSRQFKVEWKNPAAAIPARHGTSQA